MRLLKIRRWIEELSRSSDVSRAEGGSSKRKCRRGGAMRAGAMRARAMVETARESCYNDAAAGAAFEESIVRVATVERNTKETRITGRVDLDGTGVAKISTGIVSLDHMLEQLAKHSLIEISLHGAGDLHIDFNHTTEDTGYVVREAVSRALGSRAGIARYGHAVIPMDETLTRVTVDASNRPYLIWKVAFSRPKLGEMDTELFKEWFQAFAQMGGITLHVENLYGENNHHIVESCFKGVARALREAIAIDPRSSGAVPSTKGSL